MIWFDITEIKNWQGHHTGIQKVIHRIGKDFTSKENVGICYFDRITNSFKTCDYDFFSEILYENEAEKKKEKSPLQNKLVLSVKSIIPQRVKIVMKELLASRTSRTKVSVGVTVKFNEGDTVIIPGAFWIYPIEELIKIKSNNKLLLNGIMYDLVPIITPQFVTEETISGFETNLSKALELFDRWYAISENTKKDLLEVAGNYGISSDKLDVDVIHLGVDNPDELQDDAGLTPDLGVPFADGKKFSLFVSTLEARKNQSLVYLAHKLIYDSGRRSLPTIIVGKRGWLSDDMINIISKDPDVKDKIIWLERVDDRTLRWLYKNCSFTIYPSFYEGWGLPVAESLAMGKPCIASNSSSIPEIAGDLVEYFSPYDSSALSELICRYSKDEYLELRKAKISSFHLPLWLDCTEQIYNSINN